MTWIAVTVESDASASHALSDTLLEAGALSVDLSDAAAGSSSEQPIFGEPLSSGVACWPRVRLIALFPKETDVPGALARACAEAGLKAIEPVAIDSIEDEDWVRSTQQQFTPLRITQRLWIVPSWHTAPDPGAINVVLDPGLAFGTGTHPTTQLVLRWLDRTLRGGENVIDYGCGSGILAIAALKLGASAACGVDLDEQALLAARRNAMQNQVPLQVVSGTDPLPASADIVVANILADPLTVLAPLLAGHVRPGGSLALSGILSQQGTEVLAAYQPWFDIAIADCEEGWVLLSGVRR